MLLEVFFEQKNYAQTKIGIGASIGANATIVCGNNIGEYAFIGAGSVVTKEVPPFAKVYGVPATQKGWVSKSGLNLEFDAQGEAICPKTGESYRLKDQKVILL